MLDKITPASSSSSYTCQSLICSASGSPAAYSQHLKMDEAPILQTAFVQCPSHRRPVADNILSHLLHRFQTVWQDLCLPQRQCDLARLLHAPHTTTHQHTLCMETLFVLPASPLKADLLKRSLVSTCADSAEIPARRSAECAAVM